jgi:cytochrome P450
MMAGLGRDSDGALQSFYRPPAPAPQPQPLGIIGLLAALRRNPLECWARPHFEQPIVEGGLPVGHALLVHEPRAIRRVLLENAGNYQKDRLQRRVLSAGLNNGLLSAEGEQWRTQRRTVARIFAHKQVRDFALAMAQAGEAMLARWRAFGDGAEIDVAVEMTRLTLDVLERTIFSDGLGRDAESIRLAMKVYFAAIGKISPFDLMGAPDFVPRLARWRVRSTLRFFEAAIDEVIAARRRQLAERPHSAPCDMLTLLLNALDAEGGGACLSEAEVRSNILTFISAGHETTANALTWSMFLLSQSDEWRERIEAEAQRELAGPAEGLVDRLIETRAVIEEAGRLYPPIAAISRVALGPDELGDKRVKRGSLVVISPYVLHRHKLLWERPDAFDPTRFLGAARAKIDRFSYLPFGAGPRVCIGQAFALQEATLVLAMAASHFSFALKEGAKVWPLLNVTLRPENGLPMIIRPKTRRRSESRSLEASAA